MSRSRVLLIGWDAADWKVIDPLLAAGQMPNLAGLIASGVRGNIATIYPPLSPMLWTSIATGKRPYKHGVHGFAEPMPDGSGIRPITNLSRSTKALWNILNQNARRSVVTGWWPSHPAEPINGVMVSNQFQLPSASIDNPGPLAPGIVHPPGLAASLADLRVNPMELEGEIIRMFVPDYDRVDQSKDKHLHSLGKTIAETMSVHAVATELLSTQPWDFAAIYYDAIDHFGHSFMRYHPPRPSWTSEEEFELYRHVMANAYRYHDAMLGGLLRFTDENTTVILMSDHGFHSDEQRPAHIPTEAAGPAVEHRHFGVLCMAGPDLRKGETIHGASILDICPTILTLFGLPPGSDMDGKVLVNAFREPPRIQPIASWDEVRGEDGRHAPETQLSPTASAEAFKQLVELGYIAPPGNDAQRNVDEAVRELRYNLARAWRDGNHPREAATIAEELWTKWPQEHRFGLLLIECLTGLGETAKRGTAITELQLRIDRYRIEAMEALAAMKTDEKASADFVEQEREAYERARLRDLTNPGTLMLEWLIASQAQLEGRADSARGRLLDLLEMPGMNFDLTQKVAGALVELGCVKEAEAALQRVLATDGQNPVALAHLARLYFMSGRFDEAIDAAADSLHLLYFQPSLHALIGRSLMKQGDFAAAETELKVAITQNPRSLVAHEYLGELYREHLKRSDEAFEHEGRANVLRFEQKTANASPASSGKPKGTAPSVRDAARLDAAIPPPFAMDAGQIVTVVTGLPRSGTSLMMQVLAAGGIAPLTDSVRAADSDNPAGYFEFGKATQLASDTSWLPEACGKAVKIVAQLLPFLPASGHFQLIVMRRDLREVVASQKAMLARLKRPSAPLSDEELMATYSDQLERVLKQLGRKTNIRLLLVDFAELLADPAAQVARVGEFLGGAFSSTTAVKAVKPEFRRQHAG